MRLWCPTCRDDKKLIGGDDGIYKEYYTSYTLLVDRKFVSKVYIAGEDVEVAPIECLARAMKGDPGLSVYSLIHAFYDYATMAGCEPYDMVMYEVEIPEKEVLCIRPHNKIYQKFKPDIKIPEMVNQDKIVYSRLKHAVRNELKDVPIEALIKCIYNKYVVAKYEFQRVVDTGYVILCTIVNPDAFPLTNASELYVDGRGGIYAKDDFKIRLTGNAENDFIMEKGMNGCPRYYTLNEAWSACNRKTLDVITHAVKERGISESQFSEVLIGDLFPNGLRLEDK